MRVLGPEMLMAKSAGAPFVRCTGTAMEIMPCSNRWLLMA